jgi:hypothetical protein
MSRKPASEDPLASVSNQWTETGMALGYRPMRASGLYMGPPTEPPARQDVGTSQSGMEWSRLLADTRNPRGWAGARASPVLATVWAASSFRLAWHAPQAFHKIPAARGWDEAGERTAWRYRVE